jgi:hypothetical protein
MLGLLKLNSLIADHHPAQCEFILIDAAELAQTVIFYLECNRRQSTRASYGFFFDIASKQSDGTHLSAITQNSRHGGTPV